VEFNQEFYSAQAFQVPTFLKTNIIHPEVTRTPPVTTPSVTKACMARVMFFLSSKNRGRGGRLEGGLDTEGVYGEGDVLLALKG
jgi:hypothetical protein